MQTTEGEKPAQQVFQMEWRQCPGCPQEFKVLTTSKQIYHSKACEIQSGGAASAPVKKKKPWESLERDRVKHGAGTLKLEPPPLPAYSPPKSKPLEIQTETVNDKPTPIRVPVGVESIPVTIEIPNEQKEPETLLTPSVSEAEPLNETPSHEKELGVFESLDPQVPETTEDAISDSQFANHKSQIEERWQSYVDRGRGLVSAMARDRLAVAELAFEACDIVRGGGGHWRDFEGTYTMKKFSEDIGIAYKTLANWVRVKRNVYDKLVSIGIEIDPTLDWPAMTRVADRCDVKMSAQQVLRKFQALDRKGPFNPERYFLTGLRRIRSLNHFLTEHNPKKKTFAAEDLKELKSLCRSIGRWIDS